MSTTSTEWVDGVRRIHAEAQGLLRLWFITPHDAVHLAVASLVGDHWATGLLRATMQCAARVRQAPRRRPSLCLCCPRPVRRLDGALFCVAVPEVDKPAQALGSVICSRCATASDLQPRAIEALRSVWPDIREIEVMPGSEAVN